MSSQHTAEQITYTIDSIVSELASVLADESIIGGINGNNSSKIKKRTHSASEENNNNSSSDITTYQTANKMQKL